MGVELGKGGSGGGVPAGDCMDFGAMEFFFLGKCPHTAQFGGGSCAGLDGPGNLQKKLVSDGLWIPHRGSNEINVW